jgi:bis(5'-nucleosyl)-tetraphosphatase (symmetrical)
MAIYFVGDVQGCYQELRALLAQVDFTPENDQLWLAGDLVARGPDS